VTALVITVFAPAALLACPMCFGAADSGQVHAAKVGILVLLACIVPILAAIGFIARSWAKRAREIARQQAPVAS
jgi:hypothetical protein